MTIPKELDKDFNSKFEFIETVSFVGTETVENFKKIDKEKQGHLINNLESLLNKRKTEAGEKYFGYRSEDIEMLDFYKSFIKRNPSNIKPYAHFSICYYLYLRKDLPKDLIEDFEKKFSIEIPENLKSFDNLDEYLDISDKDLLEPFKKPFNQKIEGLDKETLSMDFVKMQEYLYDKIDELDQKIKATKIQPERLDINEVLESEGFKKENMSEEEYKKMVLTYKTLIELPMREKIEKEFGIELKNFNIREQVQFVNFLSSKTIAEVEKVKEFLNQSENEETKNNRIKSFLSLESDEEMGKKILNIGEKFDIESADAVFAKYAEIINLIQKNKEDLEALLRNKKGISDEEKEKITRNLISKANQVLVDFSGKIDSGGKINKDDILEELKDVKENMILTASVYKGINKNNEIKFEDLEGVTFEKKTATDLSDMEISQMMKIYSKNYEYNPKFQKAILENFENILKNLKEKTILYLFKEDNEVVAFNRFDEMGDGRKYFGSFNVKPIMGGSEIGKALMRISLEKEAEENEIEADCIPETKISSLYISGNCGFVVKKINPDYKKTGVALFNIERKKENKKYRYGNYSDEEIISEYAKNNPENKYSANSDRFILKFDPKSRDLVSISEKLMNEQKYVISNYIFSKDGKEAYCAFEKAV